MSEYMTVMHLHKSESSGPDGPVEYHPGSSGPMVNAVRDETIGLSKGKRMSCGDDKMHTHSYVDRQLGAEMLTATAKPEKRKKDASVAVRRDIWCLAALQVVGLEKTGDSAQKCRSTD